MQTKSAPRTCNFRKQAQDRSSRTLGAISMTIWARLANRSQQRLPCVATQSFAVPFYVVASILMLGTCLMLWLGDPARRKDAETGQAAYDRGSR